MAAHLEHTNFTVSNPDATAAWMCDLFGWHIRWSGDSINDGRTVHVGTDTHYLALYKSPSPQAPKPNSYDTCGGLNHIALTVDDLDEMERGAKALGFSCGEHYDYEPGRRFYFHDHDNIEYEIVCYD